MKSLQLLFLLAIGALFLSQAAADTVVIIASVTPESQAIDTDGDGKVTLAECLVATQKIFPSESAEAQKKIAEGCMLGFLEIDVPAEKDVPAAELPKEVLKTTFADRLRDNMHLLKNRVAAAREEYIHSRWLLKKAQEWKKAILASVFFIFVPLYALGYFTRLHLFVGSVSETARNLFNFTGKEDRHSYLLWSLTITALIIVVEAFELFPSVVPKLTQARGKLGFQQTNWAQFFTNKSHLAHALTWLFMTSATVRRMRSTGYSVWVLAPLLLMAFSLDVNDILDEIYHVHDISKEHYSATTYLLNAIKYLGTIGYSVTFTAGVAILLFVIPEAEEI